MATRMVPFKFSATVAYMIEFGDLFASFFFDGALLNGDGAPIVTPYLEADLPQLQFRQVGDVIWITHPDYAQRKLSRTSVITFSLDAITFVTGPFLIRNDIVNDDSVTMKYTGAALTAGTVGTLISSAAHFVAGHVGALFQLTHPRNADDAEPGAPEVSTTGASESPDIAIKGNWTFNTHGTWTGTGRIMRNEAENGFEVFRTFKSNNDRNVQFSATETAENVIFKVAPDVGMSAGFSADITANTSTTKGIVRIDSITNTTTAGMLASRSLFFSRGIRPGTSLLIQPIPVSRKYNIIGVQQIKNR